MLFLLLFYLFNATLLQLPLTVSCPIELVGSAFKWCNTYCGLFLILNVVLLFAVFDDIDVLSLMLIISLFYICLSMLRGAIMMIMMIMMITMIMMMIIIISSSSSSSSCSCIFISYQNTFKASRWRIKNTKKSIVKWEKGQNILKNNIPFITLYLSLNLQGRWNARDINCSYLS